MRKKYDMTIPEGRTLTDADVLAIARETARLLRQTPGGTYREKLQRVTTNILRKEVQNGKCKTQH
jgi:hypothetical protein